MRCPRAKPHQLGSRAVRASCLPALRPACEVRRWKWSGRRRSDPRRLDGLPTKPGPGRTKGRHTPWQEPWWNAGRRARPRAERAAQAALSVARPHPFGAGLTTVRLPAFRFPFFSSLRVKRSNPVRPLGSGLLRRGARHRAGHFGPDPLAPRNDEQIRSLFDNTRALFAPRERDCFIAAPRTRGDGVACVYSAAVCVIATGS